MSDSPFFQFYPSDWLAGTRGLTAAETGIYITLVAMMYEANGPVPADMKRLSRLCGSTATAFKKCIDGLIETGKLTLDERGFFNHRVGIEIEKRNKKCASARDAGLASGRSRNDRNADLRRLRMKEARGKGAHTPLQWAALVQSLGNKCVSCGAEGHCEKDHIIPVYQGGSDGIDNLQPLCRSCNAGKGPDTSDFRPSNWKKNYEHVLLTTTKDCEKKHKNQVDVGTDVQHETNTCSTIQKPEARSQIRKKETSDDVSKESPPLRGCRLPPGWSPSQNDTDWAKREFPLIDLNLETEKFRNHWLAKTGKDATKLDWSRTWRNWVMNAKPPYRPKPRPSSGHGYGGFVPMHPGAGG